MDDINREFKKAKQDWENLGVQEAELDERLKRSSLPDEKFKLLHRYDKVRSARLAMEHKLRSLSDRMKEGPAVEVGLPRLFIICPLHSQPGKPVLAVCKPSGEDVIVLCPGCIEEGARIRKERGEQLEEVPVAKVETK